MRQFLMIACTTFGLAAAAPAAAGHTWQVGAGALNVHLSDIDLRASAGRAQALIRIEAAAARLCGKGGTYAARMACREAVVAKTAKLPGKSFIAVAMAERQQANVQLARSK